MTWKPTKLNRDQMEERRLAGARLIRRGKASLAAIARQLGVSREAVRTWAKQLAAEGLRGLRRRKPTGRPPKLSAGQRRELKRLLKRGALAAGFASDRWNLGRVRQLIKHEFDIDYHPKYLNRLLRKLGWSPQVPLPRAVERDEALIRAWLKHDWPRIKKARRRGVKIVFFDEFGFSFLEPLARTWAPKGKRPIVRRVTSERRAVSTAVGLTLSGQIYKRHFLGSMKSKQVVDTLAHVHRHLPEGFVLIWDRAKIHKSVETQTYLAAHPNIVVEWLPPYAPELNPEEYCHGNVKQHVKNATPANAPAICQLLDRGFARLRHRPDLLLGFFHEAGLTVKQLWLL